jgi:acyl-homoserine lactone acylase PvdQ
MRARPLLFAALLVAVLAPPAGAARTADAPPASDLTAFSVLPPGESGDYPASGQARYEVDGDAADFGPHVDDQREMYWSANRKSADFQQPTGTPMSPMDGVRIYRDAYGVPLVYGDNGYDVWFGAGYAAATDRLFEIDAVRRTARGTLAELAGPSDVPADVQQRTLTYTGAEYDDMLAGLSQAGQDAIKGYAAGVEARIKETQTNPTLLPAEYQVLSTTPADWTVEDTLAAGVYITRFVASQGGNEMDNVASLQELEKKYGKAKGRKAFLQLFPDDNPKAVTTVKQRFSNLPKGDRSAKARTRAFREAASYAEKLPLELASGVGTGNSPAPSLDLRLHGGSFAYAVSGSRTKTGHPMLSSNPQLDYSYPSLLYELEVHGGGYDARGVGVPGIPTVGIGHTADVAWGLTTGYSKTIDSYIETTRPNPSKGAPPQYFHDGAWHNEDCRTETVRYREAPGGVPTGPAAFSQDYQVCRTVHGPVVATSKDGRLARTVDYAMWKREIDTVEGILVWNRAHSLADLAAGVRKVTWNENVVAADAEHIGYWHPGLYFKRPAGVDQRFPLDGRGADDAQGFLAFKRMPHVVDPKSGWVANWNTKPAPGWVDGDLSGSNTRPGGAANRVVVIRRLLAAAHHLTPKGLMRIDTAVGEADMRGPGYLPALLALRSDQRLTAAQQKALKLLAGWDGRAYAPGEPGGSSPSSTAAEDVTDGPAATLFVAIRDKIKRRLFHTLSPDLRARLDTVSTESHQYDVTPMDNLALRVIRPVFAGLPPPTVVTGERKPKAVLRHALAAALVKLTKTYGAKPSSWRRHHGISHLESLTGVVGPTATEPFLDRGSWVQQVAFG